MTTAYDSLHDALSGYLSAAAAAVPPPQALTIPAISQILDAEPDVVNLPMMAFWYIGNKTWEANTFTWTQEQVGFAVVIYLPVPARYSPQAGFYDSWLANIVSAVRAQLWAHVGAGGAATGQGMELTNAVPGWDQKGNQLCRVVTMQWWPMLSNVHPIAL